MCLAADKITLEHTSAIQINAKFTLFLHIYLFSHHLTVKLIYVQGGFLPKITMVPNFIKFVSLTIIIDIGNISKGQCINHALCSFGNSLGLHAMGEFLCFYV